MIKLLVINTILSLVIFIILKIARKESANVSLILTLSMPYIGFIILLVLVLSKLLIKSDYGREVLSNEDKYGKSISLLIRFAELENKKDLISVEEALILNDNFTKRELIKDVLKKDTYKYRKILLNALMDEDTETSHYAATAITQMKSKLTVIMQKFEVQYDKNPNDKEVANVFLQAIKDCIESNIIDPKEVIKLNYLYKNTLEEYKSKFRFSDKYYNELIKTCISIKEYQKAIEYSQEFKEAFNEDSKAYILLLESYYCLKDKINFNKTISDLRNSHIKLDKESLDLLRFWIEEDKNV